MSRKTLKKHLAPLCIGLLILIAGCGSETTQATSPSEIDTIPASVPASSSGVYLEPLANGEIHTVNGIQVGAGITEEPCPQAVNPTNGCIYLGSFSDLTVGNDAVLGGQVVDSQQAFWQTVNENGGIAGFDVDVTVHVYDHQGNPSVQQRAYEQHREEILAIAHSLGSETTLAIADQLEADHMIATGGSYISRWLFEPAILESGATRCLSTMNGLDYTAQYDGDVQTIAVVHGGDPYGLDSAAGAEIWAERNGAEVVDFSLESYQSNTDIGSAILRLNPTVVVLATFAEDAIDIVDSAANQGYQGRWVLTDTAYSPNALRTPAAEAFLSDVLVMEPFEPYDADTRGHETMREAFGEATVANNGYVRGWVWSYPLKQALEAAAKTGTLTRESVYEASVTLPYVNYEYMLPTGSGDYAGDANDAAVRSTIVARPANSNESGLERVGRYSGYTTRSYAFGDQPCATGE